MSLLGAPGNSRRLTVFVATTLYTSRPRDRIRDPDLVVVAGDEALLSAATAEGMTIAAVG